MSWILNNPPNDQADDNQVLLDSSRRSWQAIKHFNFLMSQFYNSPLLLKWQCSKDSNADEALQNFDLVRFSDLQPNWQSELSRDLDHETASFERSLQLDEQRPLVTPAALNDQSFER